MYDARQFTMAEIAAALHDALYRAEQPPVALVLWAHTTDTADPGTLLPRSRFSHDAPPTTEVDLQPSAHGSGSSRAPATAYAGPCRRCPQRDRCGPGDGQPVPNSGCQLVEWITEQMTRHLGLQRNNPTSPNADTQRTWCPHVSKHPEQRTAPFPTLPDQAEVLPQMMGQADHRATAHAPHHPTHSSSPPDSSSHHDFEGHQDSHRYAPGR